MQFTAITTASSLHDPSVIPKPPDEPPLWPDHPEVSVPLAHLSSEVQKGRDTNILGNSTRRW